MLNKMLENRNDQYSKIIAKKDGVYLLQKDIHISMLVYLMPKGAE